MLKISFFCFVYSFSSDISVAKKDTLKMQAHQHMRLFVHAIVQNEDMKYRGEKGWRGALETTEGCRNQTWWIAISGYFTTDCEKKILMKEAE